MFIDAHMLVFVGFPIVMAGGLKFQYSAISYGLVIAALSCQLDILTRHFFLRAWKLVDWSQKITVFAEDIIMGDYAATTCLISFCALMGRFSLGTHLLIAIFETIAFDINLRIFATEIKAFDVGGAMVVHMFGAVFGLTVSKIMTPAKAKSAGNPNTVNTDVISAIGTIVLFITWPPFVAYTASPNYLEISIISTVIGMLASVVGTLFISPLIRKDGAKKFNFVDVQNAVLAGGVGVGTFIDMNIGVWPSALVGCISGIVCVGLIAYWVPFANKKLGIVDSCGVFTLHLVPGIISGLASAIACALHDYHGSSVSRSLQAGRQALSIVVTFAMALVTGCLVGFLVKLITMATGTEVTKYFDDEEAFNLPKTITETQKPVIVINENENEKPAENQ